MFSTLLMLQSMQSGTSLNTPEIWSMKVLNNQLKPLYLHPVLGNSKFNLILMCWPEGIASPIHDHADSHCFMRILDGEAKETRFFWPRDHCNPDGSLIEMTSRSVGAGVTAYMSDELGLHRVCEGIWSMVHKIILYRLRTRATPASYVQCTFTRHPFLTVM